LCANSPCFGDWEIKKPGISGAQEFKGMGTNKLRELEHQEVLGIKAQWNLQIQEIKEAGNG